MTKGIIILLSGVSSSGKTTLTKVLQKKFNEAYYHICCDDFMNMSPKHLLNNDLDNQLHITQGIMHEVIAMFSDIGHNVIVDDVILDLPDKDDWMFEYVTMFKGYPVLFVHVDCPVEELERREKARGDRNIGMARWQFEHQYCDLTYDLVVNTFNNATEECADRIITMMQKHNEWNAFKVIKEHFDKEREHSI